MIHQLIIIISLLLEQKYTVGENVIGATNMRNNNGEIRLLIF